MRFHSMIFGNANKAAFGERKGGNYRHHLSERAGDVDGGRKADGGLKEVVIRAIIAGLTVLLLSCITDGAYAKPASLIGAWSGSGVIRFKSGSKERARCRISYFKKSAKIYGAVAICATTSGKITQTARIKRRGSGRYSGRFHNAQYNVTGNIRVIVHGRRQTVTLTSKEGSGRLRLRKR